MTTSASRTRLSTSSDRLSVSEQSQDGLAFDSQVMSDQYQIGRRRYQTTATPDGRCDHRYRVLGSDRVVQNGGVQHPTMLVRQHPSLGYHFSHRVEDTLPTLTRPQPRPPQGQHRRVEPPPSARDRPAAAFQRISHLSRWTASRSETHSNACRTITVATTDPRTDGRPRPLPNRSPNISSGNKRRRWSAKNRYTDPTGTRSPHTSIASRNSRSTRSLPCTTLTVLLTHPTREPTNPNKAIKSAPS